MEGSIFCSIIALFFLQLVSSRTAPVMPQCNPEDGALYLIDGGWDHIPTPDKDTCTNLGPVVLYVMGNDITTLRNGGMSNYSRLLYLNLSNNNVSRIENGAFDGIRSLRQLDISLNPLKYLEGRPFASLRLDTLLLGGCGLKNIELQVFSEGCSRLTELNLANNELRYLSRQVFSHLPNLRKLDLSKNRLENLDPTQFAGNGELRVIDLSGNALIYIPKDLFVGLPSLTRLNLEDNGLAPASGVLEFSSPNVFVVGWNLTAVALLSPSDSTSTEAISVSAGNSPVASSDEKTGVSRPRLPTTDAGGMSTNKVNNRNNVEPWNRSPNPSTVHPDTTNFPLLLIVGVIAAALLVISIVELIIIVSHRAERRRMISRYKQPTDCHTSRHNDYGDVENGRESPV